MNELHDFAPSSSSSSLLWQKEDFTSSALPAPDLHMLHMLLDHIPGRVVIVGTDHRYLYVNRECLDFMGVSIDNAIGRTVGDLLGPDVFASYLPVAERLLTGESLRWEGWVDYPKQGRRYMQEHLLPYAPGDGVVQAVIAFGRDLTDLKMRELELASKLSELQTSEALKSAIVDHALAALISTDENGVIVEFNPAAEAMFGNSRESVLGKRVSDVVIPERFRASHEAGMQRMKAGESQRVMGKRLELHAKRMNGTEFPVEMVLWRTSVAGSVFYTASVVDVTERKTAALEIERQREALRQSEKLNAMGGLLAGVAHELNNPLAIVMGRAGLLEEKCNSVGALDRADLKSAAQRIREAAERCGRIVRTFLNMARSQPAERTNIGLNELVRAAIELLQYGYRTHDIELNVALADDLPLITVDGDQIGQVVMNLLVNAQQSLSGLQGVRRVKVRSGVDAHCVWLRVTNNGPEIAGLPRARVFDPFVTMNPERMGTGLGLAVSRSLARDNGGDLVLEAAHDDDITCFQLQLPICNPAASIDRPNSTLPSLSKPASPAVTRVLVIDDEDELVDVMRDMLEAAGHEVATAESGAVALEMLASARFDAIVSDLRMPDMDGAGLWQEVSLRFPVLAKKTLFVTGDTLSRDARDFLRSSGCAALDKPFERADLLREVARLLK